MIWNHMTFKDLLAYKQYTIYRLSKESGIPRTTLFDIASSKTNIADCSGRTLKAIAKTLDVKIEELLELEPELVVPPLIQESIDKYLKEYTKRGIRLDCWSCELNSNINVCDVEHIISHETAEKLRDRFFR